MTVIRSGVCQLHILLLVDEDELSEGSGPPPGMSDMMAKVDAHMEAEDEVQEQMAPEAEKKQEPEEVSLVPKILCTDSTHKPDDIDTEKAWLSTKIRSVLKIGLVLSSASMRESVSNISFH